MGDKPKYLASNVDSVKKMVDAIFGDTCVPVSDTRDALEDLVEYIETRLESL